MKIFKHPQPCEWADIAERPHMDVSSLGATVSAVLQDVKTRGDEAVKEYEEKFDHARLTDLAVSQDEMDEAERLGWPAMHAKLAQVDPVTAARLAPNDKQRIGRALEVYRMTGRPLSSFHAKRTADEAAFPVRALGLLPGDRAELHRRIGLRFERMLEAGFLDEVRGLMARPDFREESPAMRAVGYRQAIDFLRGRTTEAVFREAGCAATRQLAKRQMTWMRSMSDVTLVDPWLESAEDRGAMLAEDVERALGL